jgi:hypothetical protein
MPQVPIIKIKNSENGFVLVLALFMLSICSIMGIAALLTSTTEIDIAGNEKIHKETLYQAEAGYLVGAEVLKEQEAYGAWEDNEKFADLSDYSVITIKHGEFLFEGREDYPVGSGTWNKDKQRDTVEQAPDIEIRIKGQFNIDVDVDKIAARHLSGGGVEFAAGSEGMGVSMHKIIFNMDCIGTLPAWNNTNNRFARTLRLDNGAINPATPLSEIVVGYGFIPR